MRLRRRSFLLGAAAVCLGCNGTDEPDDVADGVPNDVVGGFGDDVELGPLAEVLDRIDAEPGAFLHVPEGRMYLVRFAGDVAAAAEHYDGRLLPGMEAGVVALYQRCPHLGCRVPPCVSSAQFECPCHSGRFSHTGELLGGPPSRGMDRFPVRIEDGSVVIETGTVIEGIPFGVVTDATEPKGPPCVAAP